MPQKKVRLLWYCLAAIVPPLGLYAFKRINKLRIGLILYAISYGLAFSSSKIFDLPFIQFNQDFILFTFISLIISGLSIAIPVIFMRRYCMEWNTVIDKTV